MARSLFRGSKEVTPVTAEPVSNELQSKMETLQAEITQARDRLLSAESQVNELQDKLDEYRNKELQIAEVMINAQISAQRIEAQARAQAEILLQQTDEELRRKNQELELLRMKVQLFKSDMHERIDHYKDSLDRVLDIEDEAVFAPTLVKREA